MEDRTIHLRGSPGAHRGERARLFPVLAETSKEGRTLSVFLACLTSIRDLGETLLASVDQRVGARTRIDTYTEVTLARGGEKKHRPDGLIVVRSGDREWSALIEAKVANADLTNEQIESYIEIGKLNQINAIITISNQFASIPSHHPVKLNHSLRRKLDVFHWSWMYVLTQAHLLATDESIRDAEQRFLLNELIRFLSHPSAGVKGFDQMPPAWTTVVGRVLAGGDFSTNSDEATEVAAGWLQEVKDLNLILSRQLGVEVATRISRVHTSDPNERLKSTATVLAKEKRLLATFVVPNAASAMDFCADIQTRTVSVSMRLKAPQERKSTKARLNWLLRQLKDSSADGVHVRFFWPGRAASTQYPLSVLRELPELGEKERAGLTVQSFEVVLVKDLGARFTQRKNFIAELETAVPEFYERIGQHLKQWHAPAPKLKEELSAVTQVTPEVIRQEAEQVADEGAPTTTS